MNPMDSPRPVAPDPIPPRRRLRAVFAADVANFGGLVTIDETGTVDALSIARAVANEELATHGGWLFGLPGDGIFALFESTVNAVRCALRIQARLAESPKLYALKLRIGVHLGEVLFKDELPYGEALVIASRLESLAEPGGILISASVMDAVASHVAATFVEHGVHALKHSPKRVETFSVFPPPPESDARPAADPLDRTVASARLPPREAAPLRGSGDAAPSVRMPKVTPFVLPKETLAQAETPPADASRSRAPISSSHSTAQTPHKASPEPPSPKPRDVGLDEASLNQFAQLLTTHIGPVARVLVRRKAAESPNAAQLIRMLALEIPSEYERQSFLARAQAVLAGPR